MRHADYGYCNAMSNLVPRQRVNKRGQTVIRHMRPDGGSVPPAAALPAPSIEPVAAPAQRKLAKSQTRQRDITMNRATLYVSWNLRRALPDNGEPEKLTFKASDAEMYAVLDVLPVPDALVMLEHGYRTTVSTREFLSEHGLDFLGDDPDTTSEEAFIRGIPADKYCEIKTRYGNRVEPEVLLDTAEAYSMKGLEKFDLYMDVLRKETSVSDIREVGVSRIAQSADKNAVREVLIDLKTGNLSFGAKDLGRVLERVNKERCTLHSAVFMADQCGVDFTLGLYDIGGARSFVEQYRGKLNGAEDTKRAISYNDIFCQEGSVASGSARFRGGGMDSFAEVYEAGVDPVLAGQLIARGMTAREVFAHTQRGIPLSIADGWL